MEKEKKIMEMMKMQKDRIQLFNPRTKRWVKVNTKTGGIVCHKKSLNPFKNVEIHPDDKHRVENGDDIHGEDK